MSTNIEELTKELYLGQFMVKAGYMNYDEYKQNLLDYNLIIVDYAFKLGIVSFKSSINYYIKQIKKRNINVRHKVMYLERSLDKTYELRKKGIY